MSDSRNTPHPYFPNSEDEEEWRSFVKNRARRKQERAQANRNLDKDSPSDEPVADSLKMSNKDDKRTNDRSPAWNQCLGAARWIPRAYDMYCNLEETIRVSSIVQEGEKNTDDDSDNETNVLIKAAYKNIVETLDVNTILRHQSVYQYLQEHTPYLMDLIRKKEHQKRAALIREMQAVINRTRSDDASHLRPVIGSYAAPHPDKKVLDPPVQPRAHKDRLGFDHPELALLLCPIRHLQEMLDDPVETKKRITSGAIKVTAQKNPAFLYEGDIPGENFNPEDAASGFMRGFLVERIMKHIFTSPSSALSTSKTHNTRACNAKIHNMRHVGANHIAYAATHARFSICSQNKFVDLDGMFKLPDFYYQIATFIADEFDEDWSNDLYAHYNKLLFDNPCGLGCTIYNADESSDEDDIAIMKKQMANRASDLSSRSRASMAVEEDAARYMNFDADDLYDNGANQEWAREPSPPAIMQKQTAGRIGDMASRSRSSTAVEEDTSMADYAGDGSDNSDGEIDQELAREPTPPAVSAIMQKQTAGRISDDTTSRSRSSMAVEEDVSAARIDIGADRGGDVNQELHCMQEPAPPVFAKKSKKPRNNTASTSNNITPVAQPSKGKSKATKDEDDSPLTDVDEDARTRTKRKESGKAIRKSTRARK